MTEQEQRIAIAEACGWTWKRALNGERYAWFSPADERETDWYIHQHYGRACEDGLPDYPHDLNAMHEAEKVIWDRRLGEEYITNLQVISFGGNSVDCWEVHFIYVTATAAQRAKAFLRTLGKWPSSPLRESE